MWLALSDMAKNDHGLSSETRTDVRGEVCAKDARARPAWSVSIAHRGLCRAPAPSSRPCPGPPKFNIMHFWFREKMWTFPPLSWLKRTLSLGESDTSSSDPMPPPCQWGTEPTPIPASLDKAITKHEQVRGCEGTMHVQLEPVPAFFALLLGCLTSSYIHFSLPLP